MELDRPRVCLDTCKKPDPDEVLKRMLKTPPKKKGGSKPKKKKKAAK